MGSNTLAASHIAIPLCPECFCSTKSPVRQKDCLWALCEKGLSTITQVMCGHHLSLPGDGVTQCTELRKSGLVTPLCSAKEIVSLLGQHIHACVVEFRFPCSHFGCCDFGGAGVRVWIWDEVKGNKGLWFQRVSTSQLISHVREAVLGK